MNRRRFLVAGVAFPALTVPAMADAGIGSSRLRGAIGAPRLAPEPVAFDHRSVALQSLLDDAAARGLPVDLPAGDYVVSNIRLPDGLVLRGVPGRTRLIHGGGDTFLHARAAERLNLSGLVIDGANRWLSDTVGGALDVRQVASLAVSDCVILGSGRNGLHFELCGGRVENCTISGAASFGLYSVESLGLRITGNRVAGCADGGIAVHRWQAAEDGSRIVDNDVRDIGARSGGTGQWGNGINVFRANGVTISGNRVSGCAFSAIRANSASNIAISGNECRVSGETGLYVEFAFEAASISGNIVDGAANGISVVNFNEGGRLATVTGNVVRNLSTSGPYRADPPGFGVGISVEADTTVAGNVVENAPLYGINCGWGAFLRNVAVTGNVVRDARFGIAATIAEGAQAALISDNVIAAHEAAVVGHEWERIVTRDLTLKNARVPANLTVERNRTG